MKASGVSGSHKPRCRTLPNEGGTYALLLHLAQPAHLQVGRLGRFAFPSGYYLYLGSALGGLRGRLSRHLRRPVGAGCGPPLRWHIDYLMPHAVLLELWWQDGREERECAWAALARVAPGASLPVPRFGSSDCRCVSHLAYFPTRPSAHILGNVHSLTLGMASGSLETSPPTPSPWTERGPGGEVDTVGLTSILAL